MMMTADRELWAAAYRLYQNHVKALEGASQDQLSAFFEKLARDCSTFAAENGPQGQLFARFLYELIEARTQDQRREDSPENT